MRESDTPSPMASSPTATASSSRLRFGAHMPTAGGLHKSVTGGAAIGCDTIQLFTASPRQWNSPPLDEQKIRAFRRAVEKTEIYPLVAHDSYLINLATQDEALREKSRQAFLAELRRCEALGIDYLVTHLGAHTGAGVEAGLECLADSLTYVHGETEGFRVQIALETTAGQGTHLGGEFAHFPYLFERVGQPERLRVCLDTCHIFVAGYDLRTSEAVRTTITDFDQTVGLSRLCVIHANDAQKGLGSHTDRHAHIGCGTIGNGGFAALLAYERWPQDLPIIVETPETETMHRLNVWHLRRLAGGWLSSPDDSSDTRDTSHNNSVVAES